MSAYCRAICLLFAVLLVILPVSCNSSGEANAQPVFAFNTVFSQSAYGDCDHVFSIVAQKLADLERIYSRTDTNSELYKINTAGGGKMSDTLARAFSYADKLCITSNGAFDITLGNLVDLWDIPSQHIPNDVDIAEAKKESGHALVTSDGASIFLNNTKLDLGGIAKGIAVGEILKIYKDNGLTGGIVSCSSSVGILGNKPNGDGFKIAVKNPDGEDYLATVECISNSIVSTSGDYEQYFIGEDGTRYHHILDPATGYPAQTGIRSVTVEVPISDFVEADYVGAATDALSTAAFVMGYGEDTLALLAAFNANAVFVMNDGTVYATQGIRERVNMRNTQYVLAE